MAAEGRSDDNQATGERWYELTRHHQHQALGDLEFFTLRAHARVPAGLQKAGSKPIPAGVRPATGRYANEEATLPETTQTIILSAGTVGTLIMGAINWLFKRQIKINDEYQVRITELEVSSLQKADLDKVEQRSAERFDKLDNTITEGFKEAQRTLGAAHKRIDDIYRDIPKRD
jgi:hypothetical protein